MNKVTIQSPQTGEEKTLSPAFSFTTFFFSFIVALIRKDWKWAGIMFVVNIIFAMTPDSFRVVGGIPLAILWGAIYNRSWIKERVLNDGWVPVDEASKAYVEQNVKA